MVGGPVPGLRQGWVGAARGLPWGHAAPLALCWPESQRLGLWLPSEDRPFLHHWSLAFFKEKPTGLGYQRCHALTPGPTPSKPLL